jgi:ribosome-associated translation inhibitor RaiA
MSKQKTVTEKAVFDTADELLKSGMQLNSITNSILRESMGGGSFSDIGPLLRKWKDDRITNSGMFIEIPDHIKVDIDQFTKRIWDKSYQAVHASIAANYEDYQDVKQERDSLYAEVDEVNKKIDTQIKNLANLQHKIYAIKAKNTGAYEVMKSFIENENYKEGMTAIEKRLFEMEELFDNVLNNYFVVNVDLADDTVM